MELNVRVYEQELPAVDETVMVQIEEITELGVYARIVEYGDLQGMIPIVEISRCRIRSVRSVVRQGAIEPVGVLRVDRINRYVDLSRVRVSKKDRRECLERYNNNKAILNVLRAFANAHEASGVTVQNLLERFVWPLARPAEKRYPSPYAAFQRATTNPEEVWPEAQYPDREEVNALVEVIRTRMAPPELTIRAMVDVTCFSYEGVESIKKALLAGAAQEIDGLKPTITIDASPSYLIRVKTREIEKGKTLVQKTIDAIRAVITANGGTFAIKEAITVEETEDERRQKAHRLASREEEEEEDEDEDDSDDSDDSVDSDDLDDGVVEEESNAVAPVDYDMSCRIPVVREADKDEDDAFY